MSVKNLVESLKAPTAEEVKYVPKTEFDGVDGFIQTKPLENPPTDYDELLEMFGYDPTQVEIVGDPRTSRWQTYDERWLSSFRFHIRRRSSTNVDDLFELIRRHKAKQPIGFSNPGAFNFQAGDQQLGKSDQGGSEGIVECYLNSVDNAVAEFKALKKRHSLGIVHLMFPGDCIEGYSSQGGKNVPQADLTLTEQIRVFRRLLLHTIKEFAPLADSVLVDVVGGNHDETTRQFSTRADDNHAVDAAIAVSDALKMNDAAYGHVEMRIPPTDQSWMTVPAGDTVFTIAHGHQFPRRDPWEWVKNQALNMTNVSATQFLAYGHHHTFGVKTVEKRVAICSPTFEGGSNWLQNGSRAKRGGAIYVTNDGEFSNLMIV